MVAFRLAQPLALGARDVGPALACFLADTRLGTISAISLPDQCLVRMVRRHDRPECVVTWEPAADAGCSFLGSMSVMECGRGTFGLILDGLAEVHDRAQLEDEHLARVRAEATGRAVLKRVAAELALRSLRLASPRRRIVATAGQRPMSPVSPMRQAANARSARWARSEPSASF